jgi:inositol-phosphate phosphatase/L-galactose 1-phosphate phosphatase/histidinol-phosphatase
MRLVNHTRITQNVTVSSAAFSGVASDIVITPEVIALAHDLAEAAAVVTSKYFRTPVPVDVKPDASPVTIADRQAEDAMRDLITRRFPHHSIFGEERGYEAGTGNGDFMWVLDPIDGTKSFITGKPVFGTLIALLHNGRPVLGVIDQPILKERWLGIVGQGTTLNGAPIRTRACADPASAYLYATTPHMFRGWWAAFTIR